ncbi:hypothetical protein ACFFUB_09825 [Algimonas porphyrae]|uniref:Uncharacterized protein n=1 Tax=Algimonas porphyrae TaxID=1128113 RepID=A0ABQ5V3E8_9PROT|nr:hypothetical protein [Algimonas porphyrae]GLQ21582.1 hypothetical protein GCM10007854_25370 [Algimonas porphyrae]
MNFAATAFLVSAITVMPQVNVPQIALPTNPVEGLSISAAGIGVEITADGVETLPAKTSDFQIELRLKSGTPIRVRL